jgi:hypothetical protein
MNTTLFVTCIYLDLQDRVGNGSLTAMSKRYMESAQHLAERGNRIVVYTDAYSLNRIKAESHLHELATVHIIERELNEMPFYEQSQQIISADKERFTASSWLSRNPMVMFGKFVFLEDAMNRYPNYESVFWIDAGLFHGGLFPNHMKGNSSKGDFDYPLITENLGNDLCVAVKDKLFFIRSTALNHGYIEYEAVFDSRPTYGVVAGIFGGNRDKLKSFVSMCMFDVQFCISKNSLLKEEEIIFRQHKLLSSAEPESVTTFTFDSWYHPDWTEIFNDETMTGFYEWHAFLTDRNYKVKHDYTF